MSKPILLDGATGTAIWSKVDDKKPVWTYNITNPEVVKSVHKEYVEAGAQIIFANTFSINKYANRRNEYSLDEVVEAALKIAKEAVEGTETKIALTMGPLPVLMEPYGDLEEEEVYQAYDEILQAASKIGFDYVVYETFLDLNMMKVAVEAAKKYEKPIICSMTFEKVGKTMFGNSVGQICEELEQLGIDAIGMNCSLGPQQAVGIIEEFSKTTKLPLFFKPNAGLPITSEDGKTEMPYTAADFAREVSPVIPLVSYIGSCCGSDYTYTQEIRKEIEKMK